MNKHAVECDDSARMQSCRVATCNERAQGAVWVDVQHVGRAVVKNTQLALSVGCSKVAYVISSRTFRVSCAAPADGVHKRCCRAFGSYTWDATRGMKMRPRVFEPFDCRLEYGSRESVKEPEDFDETLSQGTSSERGSL